MCIAYHEVENQNERVNMGKHCLIQYNSARPHIAKSGQEQIVYDCQQEEKAKMRAQNSICQKQK